MRTELCNNAKSNITNKNPNLTAGNDTERRKIVFCPQVTDMNNQCHVELYKDNKHLERIM